MQTSDQSIVIVDYDLGNLFSLERVVTFFGASVVITKDPQVVRSASKVILPGVGAFEDGMHHLRKTGMGEALVQFSRENRPLLGICLGMQLLMDESEENGLHKGLGIIPGRVVRLESPSGGEEKYKIPHIGWNRVFSKDSVDGQANSAAASWEGTILSGIPQGSFTYFVHSYVAQPQDQAVVLAETEYGHNRFCSSLKRGLTYACQFHPEVSGEVGLQILKNFIFNINVTPNA